MGKARAEDGFALLTVLWGLGLVALLSLAVISASRWRVKATGNLLASARAQALAEAGVNMAILHLLAPDAPAATAQPLLCALPDGAVAAISLEDEGGKVDLNAAPAPLLAALLGLAGADAGAAPRLAAAIVEFRIAAPGMPAAQPGGGTKAARHGLFQTIYELDQVPGIDSALLRAILPYANVHSRQPGIDQHFAAPQLLRALAGLANPEAGQVQDPEGPVGSGGFYVASSRRSFLVRAEVALPGNSVFTREALVELGAGNGYVVHEWRTGQRRHFTGPPEPGQPRC